MEMILHYLPTSTYVRKVSVLVRELGFSGQVACVPTDPWASDNDLPKQDPLGKVPTLITEAVQALFDSHVIREYLDGIHGGPKLIPEDPKTRIEALQFEALGDGVLDAAVLAFDGA